MGGSLATALAASPALAQPGQALPEPPAPPPAILAAGSLKLPSLAGTAFPGCLAVAVTVRDPGLGSLVAVTGGPPGAVRGHAGGTGPKRP